MSNGNAMIPWCVQSIVDFQRYFGLTLQESIKLLVHTVSTENALMVRRHIAYNRQDRVIPITTVLQRKAIQARLDLLQGQGKLTALAPLALLEAKGRAALGTHALSAQGCRQYYAHQRLKALHAAGVRQNTAIQQVQKALGIQHRQGRYYR